MAATDLPPDGPVTSLRWVKCPQCGGPSAYGPSNRYRPFCGERCKGVDLGAWASEHFRLPEHDSHSHPDFEQS